ncbi:winged helix-turn-helix transcriptional regulator [Lutimaribacter marinistellae]|uniref:Winged helix-turn-helix transcriptional regulator n=1 Tax=Lutimaribacter marinistellae TaxID=1820329 RepID=A0ABV7TCD8_9RHOB
MRRTQLAEEYCSIARAGAQLVDAWTLMILRELFLSNRSFEGIRQQTGMAPASLAARLGGLEEAGILERRSPKDKPRKAQYLLTEKGLELWPAIIAIKQWGDKWFGPWADDQPPVVLEHKGRDHPLVVQVTCACCGEPVSANESLAQVSPVFAERRNEQQKAAKAARREETGK